MRYACIIPCFNEFERIDQIFEEILKLNQENIDWFLLDNGSLDNSYKIMKKNINECKHENVFILRKENNEGYGSGLKYVISILINQKELSKKFITKKNYALNYYKFKTSYKGIAWTHADGQTPIGDLAKAIEIADSKTNKNFLIKGKRIKRKDIFFSSFFTFFLNLIEVAFFSKKIISPNSQPTLICQKLLKSIYKKAPENGLFDLYISILSSSYSSQINRFPVIFFSRESGLGENEHLINKLKFSIDNLKFLWSMRSYSRFNKRNN